MTTGLPDHRHPERRQQILPEGVIRAKDNVDDFTFTSKPRQEEAEHNMGYYMVELNNRNLELEDEVARKDRKLRQLRQQVAEYQRNEEKRVFAIDPAALPGMSDAAQLAKQRESIRRLERKNEDMAHENSNLRSSYAAVAQQRDDAVEKEAWVSRRAVYYERMLAAQTDETNKYMDLYRISESHCTAWKIAAVLMGLAFVGTLIIGA